MNNPAFDLSGKVAIVTGGSRGIGLASARALALCGARVMILSRKEDSCRAAVDALRAEGLEAAYRTGHAAREENLGELVAATLDRFGRLDILVANAGINPSFDPLVDLPEESFGKILDTNVGGALRLARHGLPHVETGGAMILMSSINAGVGFRGGSAYGMTKAAMEAMTRQLSVEWAERDIRVNAIRPGTTRTDMVRKLVEQDGFLDDHGRTTPLRRIAEPEDIGNVVAFLASPAARHVTGQILTVDGGQGILRGPA